MRVVISALQEKFGVHAPAPDLTAPLLQHQLQARRDTYVRDIMGRPEQAPSWIHSR
jgi:hypothetical protein